MDKLGWLGASIFVLLYLRQRSQKKLTQWATIGKDAIKETYKAEHGTDTTHASFIILNDDRAAIHVKALLDKYTIDYTALNRVPTVIYDARTDVLSDTFARIYHVKVKVGLHNTLKAELEEHNKINMLTWKLGYNVLKQKDIDEYTEQVSGKSWQRAQRVQYLPSAKVKTPPEGPKFPEVYPRRWTSMPKKVEYSLTGDTIITLTDHYFAEDTPFYAGTVLTVRDGVVLDIEMAEPPIEYALTFLVKGYPKGDRLVWKRLYLKDFQGILADSAGIEKRIPRRYLTSRPNEVRFRKGTIVIKKRNGFYNVYPPEHEYWDTQLEKQWWDIWVKIK